MVGRLSEIPRKAEQDDDGFVMIQFGGSSAGDKTAFLRLHAGRMCCDYIGYASARAGWSAPTMVPAYTDELRSETSAIERPRLLATIYPAIADASVHLGNALRSYVSALALKQLASTPLFPSARRKWRHKAPKVRDGFSSVVRQRLL